VPGNLIINDNSLVEKFGYWPDFHDFEILRLKMDRSGPFIAMHIYGFQALKETDEKGCFKKANECVITLRFNSISDVVLEDFNQQNVLSELTFQERDGLLKTIISTSFGLCGYIISETVEVVKIEPYQGRPV
jgi:hypothetical protein